MCTGNKILCISSCSILHIVHNRSSLDIFKSLSFQPTICGDFLSLLLQTVSFESKDCLDDHYSVWKCQWLIIKTDYKYIFTVLEIKIWIYWSESSYWIYAYIVLNKNWKIYWSQSFTGLGSQDWCSSWRLTI